jgi:hypothetical protein
MVWAKTKLLIQDDLLHPEISSKITFEGPNVEIFYREVPKLLISAFRAGAHELQEKEVNWVVGGKKFSANWELYKELDKYSYYAIQVKVVGGKNEITGKVKVGIKGYLRTEYPQDTIWQKSLLYEFMRMFWHTSFYAPRHLKYLAEGRRLIGIFIEDVKRLTHDMEQRG